MHTQEVKKMAKDMRVDLRISKDLKDAAMARTNTNGVTLSELIRQLLTEWVGGALGGISSSLLGLPSEPWLSPEDDSDIPDGEVIVIKATPRSTLSLNHVSLGAMALTETSRTTDLLRVLDRYVKIDGVAKKDVPMVIRGWKLADLDEIGEALRARIKMGTECVETRVT